MHSGESENRPRLSFRGGAGFGLVPGREKEVVPDEKEGANRSNKGASMSLRWGGKEGNSNKGKKGRQEFGKIASFGSGKRRRVRWARGEKT